MEMPKKLLVLGGKPIASCDIVEYAKSVGAYTIVADYLPPEFSPAKKIADESWEISTADIKELSDRIEKNNVNAVFTGVHEFNIDKAITLCEKFGFPFYASRDTYEKLSNKAVYKKLIADSSLPTIKEYYKGELAGLDYESIKYPVMVKPVDGSSGFGVKICRDKEDLTRNSKLAVDSSNSSAILVEEYVEAPEVTIFYIARNGDIFLSAMADRETYSFQEGIIPLPVMYYFPSKHLHEYQQNFDRLVKNMLSSVGVRDGMLFMQAFWKDGKVYIYDIGYRLTGTQEYNLLSVLCGYNPLNMLVDYSLDGEMGKQEILTLVNPTFSGKYAGIVTLLMMPGTIAKFEGIGDIEKLEGVEKFILNHEEGETIGTDKLGTLVQIVARAFVIAENREALQRMKVEVNARFKVLDINGNDLLIR